MVGTGGSFPGDTVARAWSWCGSQSRTGRTLPFTQRILFLKHRFRQSDCVPPDFDILRSDGLVHVALKPRNARTYCAKLRYYWCNAEFVTSFQINKNGRLSLSEIQTSADNFVSVCKIPSVLIVCHYTYFIQLNINVSLTRPQVDKLLITNIQGS